MLGTYNRIDELLAANVEAAKSRDNPPLMKDMRKRPGEPILVVTCMDPRVVPEQFLGPSPKVAVVRNAGARCSPDVVRSVVILRSLRRDAEAAHVMVVHHTDCGATHITADEVRADIRARDKGVSDSIDNMNFGLFAKDDLEKVVKEDVSTLRAEELLKGVSIRGFILELETGLLCEVHV